MRIVLVSPLAEFVLEIYPPYLTQFAGQKPPNWEGSTVNEKEFRYG
jgi:hypothetical protein